MDIAGLRLVHLLVQRPTLSVMKQICRLSFEACLDVLFFCACDETRVECGSSEYHWLPPEKKQKFLDGFTANFNVFSYYAKNCTTFKRSSSPNIDCTLACNVVDLISPSLSLSSVVPTCSSSSKKLDKQTVLPSSSVKTLAEEVAQLLGSSTNKVLWQVYKHRTKSLLLTNITLEDNDSSYSGYAVSKDWLIPASCKDLDNKSAENSALCTPLCALQKRFSDGPLFATKYFPDCSFSREKIIDFFHDILVDKNINAGNYQFYSEVVVRNKLDSLLEDYRRSAEQGRFSKKSKCKASEPQSGKDIPSEWCVAVCAVLEPFCDKSCFKRLETQDVFECIFFPDSKV